MDTSYDPNLLLNRRPASTAVPIITKSEVGDIETHVAPAAVVPQKPSPTTTPNIEIYTTDTDFWAKLGENKPWQKYNKTNLELVLTKRGKLSTDKAAELIAEALVDRRVAWAGGLAGYCEGVHQQPAKKTILVTTSPDLIQPEPGPTPVFDSFISSLLGQKQGDFLFSWLAVAVKSFRHFALTRHGWTPGQALIICGPSGAGKTQLILLISRLCGDRRALAFPFMSGDKSFNGNLTEAEILYFDDDLSKRTRDERRRIGAQLKKVCVGFAQQHECKGIDALDLSPRQRLIIACNDSPDAMSVLPPLEEPGLTDKMMVLRANGKAVLTTNVAEYEAWWATLIAELPAIVARLLDYKVPASIADPRYGVRAYANPTLSQALAGLSDAAKLAQLLEDEIRLNTDRRMTANQIHKALRESQHRKTEAHALFGNNVHSCGQMLAELCRTHRGLITKGKLNGGVRVFIIKGRQPQGGVTSAPPIAESVYSAVA